MKPSCNRCGNDIIWEGFDLAVDEHICGICIVSMRIGAERERERIIKLLEDYAGKECGFGIEHDFIALIKGENK